MDTRKWGFEFTEARQRLFASSDFHALRGSGHDLKDGVVLTSVSDVPFEMSFKVHRLRCRVLVRERFVVDGRNGGMAPQ